MRNPLRDITNRKISEASAGVSLESVGAESLISHGSVPAVASPSGKCYSINNQAANYDNGLSAAVQCSILCVQVLTAML